MRSAPVVLPVVLALTVAACKGTTPANSSSATPATAPAASAPASAASSSPAAAAAPAPMTAAPAPVPAQPKVSVSGRVLERIDLASGMYLRLGTPQGEVWAAVNTANVKKGDQVTVVNAITMDGFESASLKRKFDHIVFGSLEGTPGAQAQAPGMPAGRAAAMTPGSAAATAPKLPAGTQEGMPQNMPPKMAEALARMAQAEQGGQPPQAGQMPQMPPGGMPMHPVVPVAPGDASLKVEKAEGANAHTIAELYASRTALKDAAIVVRAKVVKFSPNIMGRNWVHLRDGSGSRTAQDDDLTVTTMDSASVGDVVIVTGVLRVNKDFGAGYSYPVIIEEGKIQK